MSDYFKKFKRYEILLEYKLLAINTPRHMYIYPKDDYHWSGMLYIHAGVYKNAVIQFTIVFENFPEQGPQIYVHNSTHHPLVDRSGLFDASYQFATWKSDKDHVFHLLHFFNNTFREDVLLMISSKHVDQAKIYESLRRQQIGIFGNASVDEIDEDTYQKMRQIMFDS
eukprot:NODE_609_length_5433_cov_1.015186.p4 type:complete len:168 gc:universal NODE_609_length_5433_cov_1.015186:1305-1808(+)